MEAELFFLFFREIHNNPIENFMNSYYSIFNSRPIPLELIENYEQEGKKKCIKKFCIINSYYCKNKINLDWKLVNSNNGASQLFEFERSAPYCLREQHGVFFRFIARLGNPPKQIFHIQKKKKRISNVKKFSMSLISILQATR